MKKHVYLVVTSDRYELPMYICDSATELAELLQVKRDTVYSYKHKGKGVRKPYKILKVAI